MSFAPIGEPPGWPVELQPIVIAGATATGKTAVALRVAAELNGEIINADSMQVYRGLDIGTAKPGPEERRQARFHLVDIADPGRPFTVADWKQAAEEAIAGIVSRGRRPVVCGGTGLYIRSLLDGWSLASTPANPRVRERLQEQAKASGTDSLRRRLEELDPGAASRIHPNDLVRHIRALEVIETTGVRLSALHARDTAQAMPRPAFRIGLRRNRPELAAIISRRAASMLGSGWEEEVRRLLEAGIGRDTQAMRGLGYRELAACICGEEPRSGLLDRINTHTRRFAKRQETWFKADSQMVWLDVSGLNSAEASAAALSLLGHHLQQGAGSPTAM